MIYLSCPLGQLFSDAKRDLARGSQGLTDTLTISRSLLLGGVLKPDRGIRRQVNRRIARNVNRGGHDGEDHGKSVHFGCSFLGSVHSVPQWGQVKSAPSRLLYDYVQTLNRR